MTDVTEENKDSKPFGLCLKEARESLGLSLEELPKTLNLDIDILVALENSDIAKLPPAIYVQGYIKAYTKALGISSDAIHADYLKMVGRGDVELKPRSSLPLETDSNTPIVKTFSILLGVLALSAALFGVYNYYADKVEHNDHSSTDKRLNKTEVIPLPNNIVVTQNARITDDELIVFEPVIAADTSNEVNVKEQAIQTKNNDVSTNITSGPDVLLINASEESWADIRDANQQKLYLDNLKQNQILRITGEAPFDIFLGNAPDVRIEINGVEVDMSDYVRINNVAHINVSEKSNHIVFY